MKIKSLLLTTALSFSISNFTPSNIDYLADLSSDWELPPTVYNRSMQQVSSMKYTGGTQTIKWDFKYNSDGYLQNIEKKIDGENDLDQNFTWNFSDQLQSEELEYASGEGNLIYNYNWNEEGLEGIQSNTNIPQYTKVYSPDSKSDIKGRRSTNISLEYVNGQVNQYTNKSNKNFQHFIHEKNIDLRLNDNMKTQCNISYDEKEYLQSADCRSVNSNIVHNSTDNEEISRNINRKDYRLNYTVHRSLVTNIRYEDIFSIATSKMGNNDSKVETLNPLDILISYHYVNNKITNAERKVLNPSHHAIENIFFTYDQNGRMIKIQNEEGLQLEIVYNDNPMEGLAINIPDVFGFAESIFDLNGHVFAREFNAESRINPRL